jgi:hypothetical protein
LAKKPKPEGDAQLPRFSLGQPIVAVGKAPTGEAPFVPSRKELEEGIRAAAKAHETAVADEFRRFGKRKK